ncbi:LGFP repeat-containing protein [Myxococcus stipitatus]|nr:hypothetical protein [Myxococcus stipitatus]
MTSRLRHTSWRGAAASLALLCCVLQASPALAWKPIMHVYLAEQARLEALQRQGSVSLQRVDFWGQSITGDVGVFAMSPADYAAVRDYPAYYRAGVLGPDAYPDVLFGQTVIHPATNSRGPTGGADSWLRQLVLAANTPQERAFALGFVAHGVGDMFGHTMVNEYAGGPFVLGDNARKHLVVEGWVGHNTPPFDTALYTSRGDDPYRIDTQAVNGFIYEQFINARRSRDGSQKNVAWQLMETAPNTTLPGIFTRTRARLLDAQEEHFSKLTWLKERRRKEVRQCGQGNVFACGRALDLARRILKMQTLGRIRIEYNEAWVKDIDRGLRAWPATSTQVARALFMNPDRQMNTDLAKQHLTNYAFNHACSMAGAPDASCTVLSIVRAVLNIIAIPFDLLSALKEELLNYLVKKATGNDIPEWKEIFQAQATHVDLHLPRPSGTPSTSSELNGLMHLTSGKFDETRFAPAFNTVAGIKMSMISDRAPWVSALQQAGLTASQADWTLDWDFTGQIHLDYLTTFDGDNQWQGVESKFRDNLPGRPLRLAYVPSVFATFFMQQKGDTHDAPNRQWLQVLPPNRTLIEETGSPELGIYVLYGGIRFGIPSPEVFDQLGFRWEDVRKVQWGMFYRIPNSPVPITSLGAFLHGWNSKAPGSRYAEFQNGAVYSHVLYGVHGVMGPALQEWTKYGREHGALGYPTKTTFTEADGTQRTLFSGGNIACHESMGCRTKVGLDTQLVGDFRGLGRDQLMLINNSPYGGRIQVMDYGTTTLGGVIKYRETYEESAVFNAWHDNEDVLLSGDFMGLGRDQVMFINRNPGDRIMVADFGDTQPLAKIRYFMSAANATYLQGWLDANDLQYVGDFMGRGHDQVLFINRGSSGAKMMIVDFANGSATGEVVYLASAAGMFAGWLDADDEKHLAGDFLHLGHDQLMIFNQGGTGGRMGIYDFKSGSAGTLRYLENWNSPLGLLSSWVDAGDRRIAGDFAGLGYDQLLLANLDSPGGKMIIYDFKGALENNAQARYFLEGSSGFFEGWIDSDDFWFAGDFKGLGRTQGMFMNRGGIGGRLYIHSFQGGAPGQGLYRESWGESGMLDAWTD